MGRQRIGRLVLLVVALSAAMAFAALSRRWPKDQTVHYVLGDGAPRVEEVDARWAEGAHGGDWTREASFRYAPGQAPRVITHEPRLANGDYTVEIKIVATRCEEQTSVVRRHVVLGGGVTSIDLASSLAPACAGRHRPVTR
jgi:hypothetical protein